MRRAEIVVVTRVAEEPITFPDAGYAPVKKGTADNQVVNSAADDPNFLGYVKNPTIKTSWATGDTVSVVVLGVIRIGIASAVAQGELVVPAGSARVKKAPNLAIIADSTTVVSTAANGEIISGAIAANAHGICGRALESGSAAGDVVDLLVG